MRDTFLRISPHIYFFLTDNITANVLVFAPFTGSFTGTRSIVSMPNRSETLFVPRSADIEAGSMSPDTFFTIIMAACLCVDAGLVMILIRICDYLHVPWVPVIVVAAFGIVLLALRVGSTLRAAASGVN